MDIETGIVEEQPNEEIIETEPTKEIIETPETEPEAPDSEDAKELVGVHGDVEMKAVNFSYIPGSPIITGLSFHAEPGSLTAIVANTHF